VDHFLFADHPGTSSTEGFWPKEMCRPGGPVDRRDKVTALGYCFTVNWAVVLATIEPEVPVKVRV
jgi:hypothetical protein